MIVVFLCAAMSLACCQSNGISSSTSIGDDNDEIRRRYEADYTDRSNEETMLENHETDLDSDDPFYERIVSYRSNRAIDVFRYSKVPVHTEFALRLTGKPFPPIMYLQEDRGSRHRGTLYFATVKPYFGRNYMHT